MRCTPIAATVLLLLAVPVAAVLVDGHSEHSQSTSADSNATPTLAFNAFGDINGVPIAQLTLTNTTSRPIYFAGYGPARPLQTWERMDCGHWLQCDYEWCGTGRSNFELAPNASIGIHTALREYRTPDMSDDPPLHAYTKPMRVVLYYGHAANDIQHPVVGESFKLVSRDDG